MLLARLLGTHLLLRDGCGEVEPSTKEQWCLTAFCPWRELPDPYPSSPQARGQSKRVCDRILVWLLKGTPVTPKVLLFSFSPQSQMLCELLFSALGWWARCRARTLHYSGGTSASKISILILNRMGPALSVSPSLLQVSSWLLLSIWGYETSIQLVFRWFSVMVVL